MIKSIEEIQGEFFKKFKLVATSKTLSKSVSKTLSKIIAKADIKTGIEENLELPQFNLDDIIESDISLIPEASESIPKETTNIDAISYEISKEVSEKIVKEVPTETNNTKKHAVSPHKPLKIISDVLFYFAIFIVLVVGLTYTIGTDHAVKFFNYSFMNISELDRNINIKQGSVLISEYLAEDKIESGQKIVYLENNSIVTGTIIGKSTDSEETVYNINSNSENSTKIVKYSNIIGEIKISIPQLGYIFKFVAKNFILIFILFILIIVVSFVFRVIYGQKVLKQ